jgi:microcystin-dependent protein
MTLYKWSQTAASDATADSTINWAEGQAPSSVNDSARAMMAATAKYRDDIAGAILTTGTSTAYTVSSYEVFDTPAHLNGQMIAFTPHTTNGATVTLNVDALGARPLRTSPGMELLAGTIIQGTPYVAVYNNSDGAFYLQGFFGNPYNVPLFSGMDYWDTIAPNSSFIFPQGQSISRTTYAAAFARWGTKFGAGDGSTTFNVPDKTGRVSAMMEAVGTRLTTAVSGVDGGTMGSAAGGQAQTLLTANLPPYTPSGSTTNGTIFASTNAFTGPAASGNNNGGGGGTFGVVSSAGSVSISQAASTFTGTAQGGASTPFRTVQPTIVCNYIIRII